MKIWLFMSLKTFKYGNGYPLIYLLLVFSLWTISCRSKNSLEKPAIPLTFIEFYERFHTDSAYQMSHVLFPLQGRSYQGEGRYIEKLWTADNWVLHRPIGEMSDQYEIQYFTLNDDVVRELIRHKEGGFSMERNFAMIDGQWKLIRYYEFYRVFSEDSGNQVEEL